MSESAPTGRPDSARLPPEIDTTVAHSARVWNYWLGGKDNYPADRELGDRFREIFPDIVDEAREGRAFLRRTVTYLARDAGLRQFLDIGTGMPTHNNTHEVAQSLAPESRIVYVDNDPLVLAHANALLVGTEEGTTDYIHADLCQPADIIAAARQRLDFSQPVAIMLMGVLGHVPDEDIHAVMRTLVDALPSGGYLALYDGTETPTSSDAIRHYNATASMPYRRRSPEQIAAFFDGLEVVEPGIVSCPHWRPEATDIGTPRDSDTRGGVARKPAP